MVTRLESHSTSAYTRSSRHRTNMAGQRERKSTIAVAFTFMSGYSIIIKTDEHSDVSKGLIMKVLLVWDRR